MAAATGQKPGCPVTTPFREIARHNIEVLCPSDSSMNAWS
jgi:hypothetical protein